MFIVTNGLIILKEENKIWLYLAPYYYLLDQNIVVSRTMLLPS